MKAVLLPLLLLLMVLSGCGSDDDLGTPINEIPRIPGADEPYQLPPEAGPPPQSPSGGADHRAHRLIRLHSWAIGLA
jgi:hypothetical protein